MKIVRTIVAASMAASLGMGVWVAPAMAQETTIESPSATAELVAYQSPLLGKFIAVPGDNSEYEVVSPTEAANSTISNIFGYTYWHNEETGEVILAGEPDPTEEGWTEKYAVIGSYANKKAVDLSGVFLGLDGADGQSLTATSEPGENDGVEGTWVYIWEANEDGISTGVQVNSFFVPNGVDGTDGTSLTAVAEAGTETEDPESREGTWVHIYETDQDGNRGEEPIDSFFIPNGEDGRGVEQVYVNDSGDIIVEYTDGTEDNLGPLPAGEKGEDGQDGKSLTVESTRGFNDEGAAGVQVDIYEADAEGNSTGNLITSFFILDGTKGEPGAPGEPGADGTSLTADAVPGTETEDPESREGTWVYIYETDAEGNRGEEPIDSFFIPNGEDGRGVEQVYVNDSGDVIVEYTDGSEDNLGPLPAGEPGEDGQDGKDGKSLTVESEPGFNDEGAAGTWVYFYAADENGDKVGEPITSFFVIDGVDGTDGEDGEASSEGSSSSDGILSANGSSADNQCIAAIGTAALPLLLAAPLALASNMDIPGLTPLVNQFNAQINDFNTDAQQASGVFDPQTAAVADQINGELAKYGVNIGQVAGFTGMLLVAGLGAKYLADNCA